VEEGSKAEMNAPNYRAARDAGRALCLHIWHLLRVWTVAHPGTADILLNVRPFAVQKRRLLVLSAGAALVAATVVFCFLQRASNLSATPVAISYFGPDGVGEELHSENDQRPSLVGSGGGLTLRITNHTQKIVHISITQIEVRVRNLWTNYPLDVMPGLRFPERNLIYTSMLNPHAAARGFVQKFPMPETSPWRIKVAVSENLVGASYVFAGIKEFLSALLIDRRLQNPFPKGLNYLGPSREVVSEEIYVSPADNTRSAK
jgi:hypothetical protein